MFIEYIQPHAKDQKKAKIDASQQLWWQGNILHHFKPPPETGVRGVDLKIGLLQCVDGGYVPIDILLRNSSADDTNVSILEPFIG